MIKLSMDGQFESIRVLDKGKVKAGEGASLEKAAKEQRKNAK